MEAVLEKLDYVSEHGVYLIRLVLADNSIS